MQTSHMYRGEPRTAGYGAARSRAVTTLLTIAEGDGWEAPNAHVSEEEKDKLLGKYADILSIVKLRSS